MANKISSKQLMGTNKSAAAVKQKTLVQSPYLYLQTTGSDGQDGTSKGFHLRWDYLRNLGATHLPKGDLARSTLNFNRRDDFVRIRRSRYENRVPTILDFRVQPPDVVVDDQRFWIYTNTNTNTVVYLHFRDHRRYDQCSADIDPLRNWLGFIEKYGQSLIELEVKDKLFFAAEIEVEVTGSNPILRAEAVSVFENLPVTDLFVSCRKMFTEENWCEGISDSKDQKAKTEQARQAKESECRPRIVSENIRFVRLDVQQGFVKRIEIETYEDYIQRAEWSILEDQFSLNDRDNTVIDRWLDNAAIEVHERWPKFNDGAKVNIDNYKDRWYQAAGIKKGVLRYIGLSDTDPMAMDTLPGADPIDGSVDVSYLDLLKLVALDFHVARMLGQGTIDPPFEDYDGPYIYMAVYQTDGLLDLDSKPQSTQHLYMSVPTKMTDYRLPAEPVLKPLQYGLYIDNGLPNPSPLTDANGYTRNGQIRFISTFIEQEDADPVLTPFFEPSELFCAIDKTSSVFFGMEYRKVGESSWRKPEIAHDPSYEDTSNPAFPVTNPIPNSGNENKSVLVHEERESGVHEYAPYGINWFSRPSALGNRRRTNKTVFVKANTLLPPANFQVQLIQEESPLLLTTAQEQSDLANASVVSGPDKTYIRVTFSYFHTHDLTYRYGDQVKLFFREDAPHSVMGKIKSVVDDGTHPTWSIVRTTSYTINSTGAVISPTLPVSLMASFVGGIFTSDGNRFIIQAVQVSTVPGEGPIFTLRKIVENTAVAPGNGGPFMTSEVFLTPDAGKTFLTIENMADPVSWGTNNPLGKVIQLGDPSWTTVTENYVEDGEALSRQLRGIWGAATISDVPEVGTGNIIGVYELQFQTYQLPHHAQAGDPDAVDWYQGVVRVAKAGDPSGAKKVLEVIKVEEIGTGQPLRIFAVDSTYNAGDPIQAGSGVPVNYYPGYRAYLLADPTHDLDEGHILPGAGAGHKKTWMGAVSYDSVENYSSNVGVPAPLIAMEFVEPFPPEAPNGGDYATRPDFYYKSTYTFTVQFTHQPFAAAFYRATETAILQALYQENTVATIQTALKQLGEEDPYRSDRWKNLISFDYVYNDPSKPYYDPTGSNPNGTFRRFPREADNFRFPKPDKTGVFTGSQEPGLVLQVLKEVIYEIFTPLTEQPLLYQYIEGGTYQPVPKPQTLRDKFGDLLDPTDPEFDQAPMAKNLGGNKIRFTDFTLDGASNMLYFYLGREIGNRGKMSAPSPISGPIFLINTKPADAPSVKKLYTVPKGPGTNHPSIEFEINGYASEQKIRKMEIYRATVANNALTVRTMNKIKTIDLVGEQMAASANYKIRDDFENELVPYGDPLFYRIIALRAVKNAQGATEWAPSQPSKLLMTALVDTENPLVPQPRFTSDLPSGNPATIDNVVLEWDTTVYNGTYYLEKMNSAGNWNTLHIVKSNNLTITVDLSDTDWGTNVLPKQNDAGEILYHRFRVRVENSSGLFGLEEKALRI